MNLSSPPTSSGLNFSPPPTTAGPSLSNAPRASGLMNEPPLSPGPAPETPAASPAPSLEAQVVRLGLMTTAEVATTMQEQAETGRPFAELAVEHGRIDPDDLARLTSGEAPTVVPVAPVPAPTQPQLTPVAPVPVIAPVPAEPAAAVPLLRQPEPTPEPEPRVEAAVPEPVVKIAVEPEAPAAPAPAPASTATKASVFVRLTSGERISAGTFGTYESAERRARELMIAIDAGGDWPHVEGRFIKPDAVVSIDVDTV
jgi:hypothetical protein